MAVKNIWSLEPGEAIVAEKLKNEVKNCDVFFPLKDTGIDLVLIKSIGSSEKRKIVTIQIKTSRWYEDRDCGTTSIKPKKLKRYEGVVDFVVVLIYRIVEQEKKPRFKREYLIIPTKELIEKSFKYKRGKLFYYYFTFIKNRIVDTRGITKKNQNFEMKNKYRDFTKYYNNWNMIENG